MNVEQAKEFLTDELLNYYIPHDLGLLWITLILRYNIVLWEPELLIGREYDEDKLDVYIIDFDKCMICNDDKLTLEKGGKVTDTLTTIFPRDNPVFKEGIIEGVKMYNNDVVSSLKYLEELLSPLR